jgi:hypothetical protein
MSDMTWVYHVFLRKFNTISMIVSSLIAGGVRRVIRRVPLVEKELFTLPEHLSCSAVLTCSLGRVVQSFSFLCNVFCIIFLSFFFWPLYCLLSLFSDIYVHQVNTFEFLFEIMSRHIRNTIYNYIIQ